MTKETGSQVAACLICGRGKEGGRLIPAPLIREPVAQEIRRDHPDWSADAFICRDDLNRYRSRHIQSLLEAEKGELTALEQEVLDSLTRQDILSSDIEAQFEQKLSFGERLADRIADIGGNWSFILSFAGLLLLWIPLTPSFC